MVTTTPLRQRKNNLDHRLELNKGKPGQYREEDEPDLRQVKKQLRDLTPQFLEVPTIPLVGVQ